MSTSQTWQELPEFLKEPAIAGHLKIHEAAEIWDHCLMAPEGFSPLPERLWPVAQLLHLIESEPSQTAH